MIIGFNNSAFRKVPSFPMRISSTLFVKLSKFQRLKINFFNNRNKIIIFLILSDSFSTHRQKENFWFRLDQSYFFFLLLLKTDLTTEICERFFCILFYNNCSIPWVLVRGFIVFILWQLSYFFAQNISNVGIRRLKKKCLAKSNIIHKIFMV